MAIDRWAAIVADRTDGGESTLWAIDLDEVATADLTGSGQPAPEGLAVPHLTQHLRTASLLGSCTSSLRRAKLPSLSMNSTTSSLTYMITDRTIDFVAGLPGWCRGEVAGVLVWWLRQAGARDGRRWRWRWGVGQETRANESRACSRGQMPGAAIAPGRSPAREPPGVLGAQGAVQSGSAGAGSSTNSGSLR